MKTKALQEYGAFSGDYAGATVLYADNSPSALKQWKGILDKEDLLKVFTPEFVRKNFRVIEMGNLLPGQNLENGQIGFYDFSFPGIVSLKIDWLKNTIKCVADNSVNLSKIKPIFETLRKNSSVFINNILQESGNSVVDFTNDVTYKIEVHDDGISYWKVEVKRK